MKFDANYCTLFRDKKTYGNYFSVPGSVDNVQILFFTSTTATITWNAPAFSTERVNYNVTVTSLTTGLNNVCKKNNLVNKS